MGKPKGHARIAALTQCALFAAILCILSPLTFPVGPVPVTLGTFAVMLTGIVLNWKKTLVSVALYLLIGLIGLPVFSGGGSGFGVFVGPTGGYLWSYLLLALIASLLGHCAADRPGLEILTGIAGCVLGTIVCYFFGTLQFTIVADYGWADALKVCVYPFVGFDLLKALCASALGALVRRRVRKAGVEL